MQTSLGRKGMGLLLCFIVSVIVFTSTTASAQVNSWISSTSGNWDTASSWSLGVLPNLAESIYITNSGWKAVAINPSTPSNYPSAMTVNNLTIAGSTNTENTLLLNYFGTAVPLTILNGLTLSNYAQLLNFDSGLIVQGGTITVTNSQIKQDGGFINITNAAMYLQDAEYDLTNGLFEGGLVYLGLPASATFNQYGGTAVITSLQFGHGALGAGGHYALYGGNVSLPNGLTLAGDNNSSSSYFQAAGTNQTTSISIEAGLFGISPSFTLNGGLLADNTVSLVGDGFGNATITQNGGTHVITNLLELVGGAASPSAPHPATYWMNAGALLAGFIDLNATSGDAAFQQTNGTVQVGEISAHASGSYTYFESSVDLTGGSLSCSDLLVTDGGGISQSGGALIVSNSLTFGGYMQPGPTIYSEYEFTGGTLFARNINVGGYWAITDSPLSNRISNPGTCTLSHTIAIGNAVEQLGRCVLASNAVINLIGSSSQLSFADSSGESWADTAMLLVTNWNGDLSGGGTEQLRFGTSQSGLTRTQLKHIWFRIASNFYSAKILNTGEVVPDRMVAPPIAYEKQGNNFILNWLAGYTLQASTNAAGPYTMIGGSTGPFTNDMTAYPQRFFRVEPTQ